jgi:hypothetical protein
MRGRISGLTLFSVCSPLHPPFPFPRARSPCSGSAAAAMPRMRCVLAELLAPAPARAARRGPTLAPSPCLLAELHRPGVVHVERRHGRDRRHGQRRCVRRLFCARTAPPPLPRVLWPPLRARRRRRAAAAPLASPSHLRLGGSLSPPSFPAQPISGRASARGRRTSSRRSSP